jgi:hypothetical protein
MQELLLDGHRHSDDLACTECPFYRALIGTNDRLPRHMRDSSSRRSAWYRLRDRSIATPRFDRESMDSKAASKMAQARYGEFSFERPERGPKDLLGRCHDLMGIGQHSLKIDGGLMMCFFIEGDGLWIPIGVEPYDRADKHVCIREVADLVYLYRADLVTCIYEAWIATQDLNRPDLHAVDYPNRREGISVECLDRTGETDRLTCEFTRTNSTIEFGEVQRWPGTSNWCEPIRKAFSKM